MIGTAFFAYFLLLLKESNVAYKAKPQPSRFNYRLDELYEQEKKPPLFA